jgi:hypothetical protein
MLGWFEAAQWMDALQDDHGCTSFVHLDSFSTYFKTPRTMRWVCSSQPEFYDWADWC